MTRCSGIPVGCAAATASRAGRAVSRQRTGPIPRAMIVYSLLVLGLSLSTLVLAGSVEIANASADSPSAREGRGSARLQPRYSWYCVQSCPDKANYVKVSTDSSGLIICNGPYSGKCGWYNDAYCSQVAPNEFAGIGDVVGHTCPSGSTNAWCVAGYKYLYNGVRDQCDNSPIVGTCIRSCPDKGNYVSVYQKGSTIRCIGPWEGKCSWYTDKYCSVVAPNEYGPSSGNKDGVTCGSRNENNWCKAGYAAIFDGDNDLTCPGDSPTCTGGTTLCSGTCVDTLSSFSNCGRCGNVCTSASTGCVGGTCYIPPADTITTTTTTTTTREIITTTTAAPPKSTDSNAAASTATYVSAPASVSMPSGAKIASIVNGDRITLRTSSAGLSCSTSGSRSCSLNSAAEGLYNIKCVSFDCKVSLLTSLANTGSCLTVIDNGVVAERTCPSNSKREVVEAYWTLLEANGQRKLMLSTRSESNGCLLATSNVGVGACSDSTAGLWGFQTETVKETTTAGPPIGAIVGGVVGGIAVIAVIAGIVWYKRRKPSAEKPAELGDVKKQEREGPPVVPFAAPNKPAEMDYAPPAPAVLGTAVAGDMDGRYPGASPSPTPTAQPRQEPSSPIGIPINGMYTAAGSYFAAADDELVARPGDGLFVISAFTDGWALCREPYQHQEGYLPLTIFDYGQNGPPPAIRNILSALERAQAPPLGPNTIPMPSRAVGGLQIPMNAKLPRTVTMRTAAESPVPPYAPSVPLTVPISLPPSSPIPPGSPLVPSATLPNSRGPTPVSAGSAPAQSKLLLSASDVVIDRNQKLGEGGFGVVYVGKLRGSVNVAVKVLRGEMDERTRAAFAKEVQTWEGLVQRNILPLMGFCVEPPMMITDLVEGGNLRQFLEARDWDQNLGRRFLLDIAQGMNYLHSMNILHGDLKSVNVLIDGNRALITDFGLSKMRSDATATMRSNRDLAGTPGFVAPEILMGEPLKKPADVFSFGMVCYEVLSRGKRPFEDAASPAAIIYKVTMDRARPPRPEDVPDAIWNLVEWCWRHYPETRPEFKKIVEELTPLV